MTEIIELDCHDWNFKQKHPLTHDILNNQGAYAKVRKTSNGAGKPATWELYVKREVPAGIFMGVPVLEAIATMMTLSKDLNEATVETDTYITGSHNESRGQYSEILVAGWYVLGKEEIKAVNLILDWMKDDKAKRAEIKKLEDKAFELRHGFKRSTL